jgi:translation initiation factor 1
MAKHDGKKQKLAVSAAGAGDALKHNPFGTLAGALPNAAPSTAAASGSARATTAPTAATTAATTAPKPSADDKKSRGRLVLRREKKGRGGKTVVIVAGLRAHAHLADSEIEKLTQHLKQQLGCGGTSERVTNDVEIVVQGDQPARVAELLRARGFRVEGVTS